MTIKKQDNETSFDVVNTGRVEANESVPTATHVSITAAALNFASGEPVVALDAGTVGARAKGDRASSRVDFVADTINRIQQSQFPVGSEWRRWDLHIHSPASILHSQYGADWDRYVHELFTRAIANQISAIGITDYFFIDGYKKLKKDYLEKPDVLAKLFKNELKLDEKFLQRIKNILILPNIEFRIEKYIRTDKDVPGSEKRLTLHVIFSDDISPEEIEEHFIRRLNITIDAFPGETDEDVPLSHSNLTSLGEKLQRQQSEFQDFTPLYIGCMVATVSDKDISELLTLTKFKNKCLIILAEEYITKAKWNGSGHQGRKLLYQKSHMIFSSNPKTIEEAVKEAFAEEFHGAKPCIWGSDAHDYEKMFNPAKGRFCWIKSDVTFGGLRQVLNEPKDRCYIGECPPGLQELRQYQKPYIASLEFQKNTGSKLSEKWFDGQALSFNSGMITIIGNKGGGKSALADALALVGNPHVKQEHFSFLRDERFRHTDANLKINRAQEFRALAKWNNDELVEKKLTDDTQLGAPERVRYLPQGYLEKLCNPQSDAQQDEFQQELDRVIFSHVPLRHRLGQSSLKELIDHRAEEIKRSQSAIKSQIRAINNKLVALEPKVTESAQSVLDGNIKLKNQELARFDEAKPIEVTAPSVGDSSADHTAQYVKKLNALKEELERVSSVKLAAEKENAKYMIQIDKVQKALDRLTRFEEWFSTMTSDMASDLAECGININDVAKAQVIKTPLINFLDGTKQLIQKNEQLCNPKNLHGCEQQRLTLEAEIEKIRSILDGPALLHQRYLAELERWKKRREEIIGSKDSPDTLLYYEEQMIEIKSIIPKQIVALLTERRELIMKLYGEVLKHAELFKEYYQPVLEFIERQERDVPDSALQSLSVSFEVVVDGSKLIEQFFLHINHGAAGTFAGQGDGRKQLIDRMPENIFSSAENAVNFVEEVIESLYRDKRSNIKQNQTRSFERQLRKSSTVEGVLNLLCQLEYLDFRTSLKFGGKVLKELSPGERGLLLLVFYLLLDKEKCPLIIDQPEENLDNQSIKSVLVPCIKDAKRRRQLFIVTHNPNIAVVCDSEQVIYCGIDKKDGYGVNYETGSIENSEINKRIVNILEGTLPAFENRTRKYKTAGAKITL